MVESRMSRKKKKRPVLKTLIITFAILLLAAGSAFAYVATQVHNVTSESQVELERGDQSEQREEAVKPDVDPVSVLFLGLDTRDGDLDGRTDAMVLATFNPDDPSIKMVNIPRDTLVPIPGRQAEDKINHAHAYGGVDLTVDTVENLFQIPVDYYVSLNFDAFMEIIDALNGVTVDSPMAFEETDNQTYGTIQIEEGEQTLDGEEALAYVRMRKSDPQGDIGRGERQKEVMASIVDEMASFNSITNFNSLLNAIGNNLYTNVAFNDMVDMHAYASELDNIESFGYDGEGVMQDGVYYYQPDEFSLEKTRQRLQVHLGLRASLDPVYAEALEGGDVDEEEVEPSGEPNLEWNENDVNEDAGPENNEWNTEENPEEESWQQHNGAENDGQTDPGTEENAEWETTTNNEW